MMRVLFLSIFISSLLSAPQAVAKERKVYDESISSTRDFDLFGGPSKEGPEAEWENVQNYIAKNKLKKAIKHAGYITQAWPDNPLAVDAQRMQADLQFARENYVKAFDAYQGLIDNYVGSFSYEEVLQLQLECARLTEYKVYKSLFGLTSYEDPMDAVPLYRQLLTNAPHMEEAPQILYDLGNIYYRGGSQLEAIQEFSLLEQRYPESPLSAKAVIRKADAYNKLSKRNPTDIRPIEGELATLTHFINVYSKSPEIPEIRLRRQKVYEKVAGVYYQQAEYYDRILKRPDAALVSYKSLVEQFPDSEWTAPARERILALSQKEN